MLFRFSILLFAGRLGKLLCIPFARSVHCPWSLYLISLKQECGWWPKFDSVVSVMYACMKYLSTYVIYCFCRSACFLSLYFIPYNEIVNATQRFWIHIGWNSRKSYVCGRPPKILSHFFCPDGKEKRMIDVSLLLSSTLTIKAIYNINFVKVQLLMVY